MRGYGSVFDRLLVLDASSLHGVVSDELWAAGHRRAWLPANELSQYGYLYRGHVWPDRMRSTMPRLRLQRHRERMR
jgi:hypothetical protein